MRAWDGSTWVPAKVWTGAPFWNPTHADPHFLTYVNATQQSFVAKNNLPWTLMCEFNPVTGTYARLGAAVVGATRFRFYGNASILQFQFISGDGVNDGPGVSGTFSLTSSRRVTATYDGLTLRVTYDGQTLTRTIAPLPFQETGGLYQLRVESAGTSALFLQRKCPDSEIVGYWAGWGGGSP